MYRLPSLTFVVLDVEVKSHHGNGLQWPIATSNEQKLAIEFLLCVCDTFTASWASIRSTCPRVDLILNAQMSLNAKLRVYPEARHGIAIIAIVRRPVLAKPPSIWNVSRNTAIVLEESSGLCTRIGAQSASGSIYLFYFIYDS
jgi:hypothetical protein